MLQLYNNKIKYINSSHFKYLVNLTAIHLWNNKITYIGRLLFSTNIKLEKIYLSNNLISQFDLDLKSLINLNVLDLKNNTLTTLLQSVFEVMFINTTIVSLLLHNNRFTCDCGTQWIRELENITNKNIHVSDTDKCQTNNRTIKCWFNLSKDICQSINIRSCDNG